MLQKGLSQTGDLWPSIEEGFALVHEAAQILENADGAPGAEVAARYDQLLEKVRSKAGERGRLQEALKHFLKVTESYRPGLFHCYDVPVLPRTNNDLEHLFGAVRYHERRATGRKVASPSLVLRGSVRIAAAAMARLPGTPPLTLAPEQVAAWRALRRSLEQARAARVARYRFRRNPLAYLKNLQDQLLQPILPS